MFLTSFQEKSVRPFPKQNLTSVVNFFTSRLLPRLSPQCYSNGPNRFRIRIDVYLWLKNCSLWSGIVLTQIHIQFLFIRHRITFNIRYLHQHLQCIYKTKNPKQMHFFNNSLLLNNV